MSSLWLSHKYVLSHSHVIIKISTRNTYQRNVTRHFNNQPIITWPEWYLNKESPALSPITPEWSFVAIVSTYDANSIVSAQTTLPYYGNCPSINGQKEHTGPRERRRWFEFVEQPAVTFCRDVSRLRSGDYKNTLLQYLLWFNLKQM